MAIKRIAIITEFLFHFGGIEKSIIELTKGLKEKGIKYDIFCGLYDPSKTFSNFQSMNVKSFTSKKFPAGLHSFYLRWKFSRLKLECYDGYVFFGFHSFAALRKHHPNVVWEQGPLAYLYLDDDAGVKGGVKKIIANSFKSVLRYIDQKNARWIDTLFSLGAVSNKGLNEAYPNIKNEILFQPVDINKYNICNKGKYYLSLARLNKNVDKVVTAFQSMPDKELMVYGSGSEEEKQKINDLAKDYSNIHVMGFAEESDLPEIYGNCIAALAMNPKEDFTMNLMEALASGKPGISINPDDKDISDLHAGTTGYLIKEATVENISAAVKLLTADKAYKMKDACKEKAKGYSRERYVDAILGKII